MPTNTNQPEYKTVTEVTREDSPAQHLVPPTSRKPKKRGLIWVVFLLIVAAVAGYAVWRGRPSGSRSQRRRWWGRRGGRGGAALGPVPVVVARSPAPASRSTLNGLGNVTAFYTVTVKSRVDGQLMKVDFNEGDLVKRAGAWPRSIRGRTRCSSNWPKGRWRTTRRCSTTPRSIERYQTLLAQDAIPKQQLDTQTALVAQYEGTIKQDTANIDNAKLQLTYAKVTAPITGVVGLRLVDPGNIVHAQTRPAWS